MQDSDLDQDHRLALVTGATGAIGKAIALKIAQQPGYQVGKKVKTPKEKVKK